MVGAQARTQERQAIPVSSDNRRSTGRVATTSPACHDRTSNQQEEESTVGGGRKRASLDQCSKPLRNPTVVHLHPARFPQEAGAARRIRERVGFSRLPKQLCVISEGSGSGSLWEESRSFHDNAPQDCLASVQCVCRRWGLGFRQHPQAWPLLAASRI